MKMLEQLICDSQSILEKKDSLSAQIMVEKLISIFSSKIDHFLDGTTLQQSNCNMVWNLNDGVSLPTDCDYLFDLDLLIYKLTQYKDEISSKSLESRPLIDSSINIDGSVVKGSKIGHSFHEREKLSGWQIFGITLGILASLATIIGLIISFL